jgi:hypothetical protein
MRLKVLAPLVSPESTLTINRDILARKLSAYSPKILLSVFAAVVLSYDLRLAIRTAQTLPADRAASWGPRISWWR